MADNESISEALKVLQKVITAQSSPGLSSEKVEEIAAKVVKQELKAHKVTVEQLDEAILKMIGATQTVKLDITLPKGKGQGGESSKKLYDRPLFQVLLSDLTANLNSYLYGAAGTGKSFIANTLAKFMGWKKLVLSCNQFTSPSEIIGGQTIEGYQKGVLEEAWTNETQDGEKFEGCILLLDELPKLDPNTAGVLNAALASKSEIGRLGTNKKTGKELRPTMKNGRGEMLELKNLYIYGSGNAPLNEADPDYEANFKQDLSLQDRFSGSIYKVFADYGFEASEMQGCLFIFNHMMLLREAIVKGENNQSFASRGFVSMRILFAMQSTFITYIKAIAAPEPRALQNPKSVKVSVDSFLEMFTERQQKLLKPAMKYDEFLKLIKDKEAMQYKFDEDGKPMLIDSTSEKNLSKELIRKYDKTIKASYIPSKSS
jgi:cobaltochelatase CobS